MRSIPSKIARRIRNITIPIAIATTSMAALLTGVHHERVTIARVRITIP
jgi:hypothetical protein